MKIVINTNFPDAVASYNYINAFRNLSGMEIGHLLNGSIDYNKFDIALFLAYAKDLESLKRTKVNHPNLKVGLIDPRGTSVEEYLPFVDFLVIDSIEMKDFFARYGLPMFSYYEYPNLEMVTKKHVQKETCVIGYHGNKLHLAGMYPNITKALELLGEKYKIEFWAMYNICNLGKCTFGLPTTIPVKHIQWSEENFINELSKADIGIVPAFMPIKNLKKVKKIATVYANFFNDNHDDYFFRFKMPSNPGRIISFARMDIPVVADMIPSSISFIRDEYNGMLAYSCGGWYYALESLILSAKLRQQMVDRMNETVRETFDYSVQNTRFLQFLESIVKNPSSSRPKIVIQQYNETLLSHKGFQTEIRKIRKQRFLTKIASTIYILKKSKKRKNK